MEHFRTGGVPLRDIATPQIGVKTGADAIFVGRLVRTDGPIAIVRFGSGDVAVEASVLRRVIRGRDVKWFGTRTSHVMVWGFDSRGRPFRSLPNAVSGYLERHRDTLERRADYRGGPLWTVFRTKRALSPHRIVWPDIARRPCGAMLDATDHADAIPLNSCYIASVRSRTTAMAITAILNSSWFAALAIVTATEARGGYRRISASVAAQLPVPRSAHALSDLAALTERAQRSDDVTLQDVDTAVAEALGLSPTDRRELHKLRSFHRR